MHDYSFEQLINVGQVRQLLESHHQLSGMAYGLFDNNENDIVSVGWQEICTRFHRVHPLCSERCRESNASIKAHLGDVGNDYFEYRCGNGMIDIAMPIIIEGRHLATFFIGQFFYEDERPDRAFFFAQAREFGFDPAAYLAALDRTPLFNREYVRSNLMFLRSMVQVLAESGLKSVRLADEMRQRRMFEERYVFSGFALDQVGEAAFLLDEGGRVQYVNQEACRSLGFSRDELLGMTVSDVDPDVPTEDFVRRTGQLLEQGSQTFESRHRARDGRTFPVEVTTTLIRYNGAIFRLALARDISERKIAEQTLRKSEAFLDTLLDTVPIPIFYKDLEGRYLGLNRAFEKAFSAPKEQLIGKTAFDMNPPDLAELYRRQDAALLEQGGIQQFESLVTNLRGQLLHVVFNQAVFADQDGRPCGMIGAIVDVTERKLAEQRLRHSEQQFRTLAENLPDVIVRYDRDCRRVYVNPAFTLKTGIPAEAAIVSPQENIWVEGASVTAGEYKAVLRRVMATGEPAEILVEWPDRHTGRVSSHYFHVVAERAPDGDINGCLAIDHDITRLRETELRLAKLAKTSPGVLFSLLMRPDGTFRMPYASHRIGQLFGLRSEEMAEDMTEVFRHIHPEDLPRVQESILESARTLAPWHLEFRVRHQVRGEVWVEGNAIPERQADGGILWYGFFHDITGRKRIERVHMARLRLFQFAATHSLDELLEATLDEVEAFTGSLIGFYHFLEADQKTLALQNWSTRTKAEFCKAEGKGSHYEVSAAGVWADCIRERRPIIHNDYASLPDRRGLPPGHAPVVRELVAPVFRGGSIVAVLGVGNKPLDYTSEDLEAVTLLADLAWEITERKKMEEELLLSQYCIDKAGIGIYQSDVNGTIFSVNEHTCRSLGYTREELCGLSIFAIDPEVTPERMLELDEILEERGTTTFNTIHRCRDGSTFPVEITANRINYHGRRYGVSFVKDITERKRGEETLKAKRAKLAALTTELSLAEERERQNIAAVLHDHIGQALLMTRIKLGVLAENITSEAEKTVAEEAKAQLDQVTRDIHNLTVQMNPPILAAVGLEAALEWLGRRMEEDYGLFVEFEDDLREKPLLDEVRSVVYQCGRELLINVAKHAGTDHARIVVAREDDRYRLTVEDDGAGFDPGALVPDTSRDCRYGLLSIQIRMERLGGSAVFESAPGQGSRMTLLAPLAPNG